MAFTRAEIADLFDEAQEMTRDAYAYEERGNFSVSFAPRALLPEGQECRYPDRACQRCGAIAKGHRCPLDRAPPRIFSEPPVSGPRPSTRTTAQRRRPMLQDRRCCPRCHAQATGHRCPG